MCSLSQNPSNATNCILNRSILIFMAAELSSSLAFLQLQDAMTVLLISVNSLLTFVELAGVSDWADTRVFDPLMYKMRLRPRVRTSGSCMEAVVQFLWLKCWGKKGGRLTEGSAGRGKIFRKIIVID